MPVAVVTGASRGLGRAFARMLADEGYALALGARSRNELEEVAEGLATDTVVAGLDVRDPASVGAFRDAVAARFPVVDVVVANAGVGRFQPLVEFDVDDFDRLFDVNVKGVWLTLRAFTPLLEAADAGLAVVVSSDVSTRIFPGGGPYCATKWAVRALNPDLPAGASPPPRRRAAARGDGHRLR